MENDNIRNENENSLIEIKYIQNEIIAFKECFSTEMKNNQNKIMALNEYFAKKMQNSKNETSDFK